MAWSIEGMQEKIKEIAHHYWEGTKKLYTNIQISRELKKRLLRGEILSRREHKHIQRTNHDVKILIPFLAFMAVPFTGYLLPILVSVFPGILPSTFLTADEQETKQQKSLTRRQKLGAQLVACLKNKLGDDTHSEEFKPLLNKIMEGYAATNEELTRHSFLWDGRLSIENFTPKELKALCHYYDKWYIPLFPDCNRRRLYEWLEEVQRDDVRIHSEKEEQGFNMSAEELAEACDERGYRRDMTEESLSSQLSGWLELSLWKGVSPSLLLISPSLHVNHPIVVSPQPTKN